jgi:hypothetical protein
VAKKRGKYMHVLFREIVAFEPLGQVLTGHLISGRRLVAVRQILYGHMISVQ